MTGADVNKTANSLKEEGNTAYKNGDWDGAINKYTEVINFFIINYIFA